MIAGGGVYAAYVAAILLGAPQTLSNTVFGVLMLPVPFLAWLTYSKAPPFLRQLWLLLASAASLWFVGTGVFYWYLVAAGGVLPDPPGPWDAIFAAARLTVIAAVLVAMKSLVSFRLAVLDASVIGAVGVAIGAALVDRGLRGGIDTSSIVLLNSPLLGTLTLMLIVSAALGSSGGVPLSTALVGAGQGLLTVGSIIYSYQSVENHFVDARWAHIPYIGGAGVLYVAAALILMGVDRPVMLFHPTIPDHPAGSQVVLLVSVAGLGASVGIALYGQLTGRGTVALVAAGATAWIGAAMALRATSSLRDLEAAYVRLDRALVETERAHDDLELANEELRRANVQIRAMHLAMTDLLNLVDERTKGRLRALIEDAGGDLADLLEQELGQARRPPPGESR